MVVMEPAYASAGPTRADRRAADRRRSAAALLSSVTSGLAMMRDPAFARERFEEELRVLVRARSMSLCDDPLATLPPNATCFDIPATTTTNRARLAAVFEPSRTLDGWTCQLLETATHIAALLLEIERAYLRSAGHRTRPDGAAPLIGSSRAIRAVRDRIERVAATDFTVLIEGESGTGKELVARQIHELEPAPTRGRSSPSTAPPSSRRCSRRSCSGSRSGRRPASAAGAASSSTRTRARCSSTKCRTCRPPRRRSCCARFRTSPSSASAATARGASTPASSWRRTSRCRSWSSSGRFRLDLYYRLHGVEVQVPPLRDRREDIIELARYFLERHRSACARCSLSAAAVGRAARLRLAGQRARARTRHRARRRAGGLRLPRARRSAAGAPRRLRSTCCVPVDACARSRCAPGAAGTPGWCSSAAATTSVKPAASSGSRITRCARTSGFVRRWAVLPARRCRAAPGRGAPARRRHAACRNGARPLFRRARRDYRCRGRAVPARHYLIGRPSPSTGRRRQPAAALTRWG